MNALERLKNSTDYKLKLWGEGFSQKISQGTLEQQLQQIRTIKSDEILLQALTFIDTRAPDRVTLSEIPRVGPITMHFVIKED